MVNRLISADSHVRVELAAHPGSGFPSLLRPAFDDAIAMRPPAKELRGGKELDLSDWDMEAFRDPGHRS